jgi:hypothetical protein
MSNAPLRALEAKKAETKFSISVEFGMRVFATENLIA